MHALDGLDLTVGEGEVHGFLGPNGAGKSTTIRVLLGLLRADVRDGPRSSAATRGADAVELHREIAYVPGDVTLWPSLTGGETIDLLARMRGGIDAARRAELIERFDLDPRKKARTYSKGNRQKVVADLGVLVACATAAARRTDVGPGSVDGAGLSRMRRRGARRAAPPCCCRATSCPRSRRCANG